MLVVTANWRFTDGTLAGAAGAPRAARAWLHEVCRTVIRAGFGRDGTYHPPATVDVVLAGDTFDCLASAVWTGRERPWHGGERARDARRRVTLACARRAAPLLTGLARLARSGLAVPAADRRGRPAAALVRVPVRVAVLAGDRDRHVAEAAAAGGFLDATVAPAWSDGAVLVRHGHEFDPACHMEVHAAGEDRPPTLAESVAIELVAGFAAGLAQGGFPPRTVAALIDRLAAAEPADLHAALVIDAAAAGTDTELDATARGTVVTAWRRAVDAWLRAARRSPPECGLPVSPVEALAAWFAADAATPPAALQAVFDRRLPAAAGPAGGVQAVVLGHPASSGDAAATLCLGSPPPRRRGPVMVVREGLATDVTCVVAAPAVGPATIVGRRDGDRLTWHRIGAADVAGAEAAAGAVVVDAA